MRMVVINLSTLRKMGHFELINQILKGRSGIKSVVDDGQFFYFTAIQFQDIHHIK